MKFVYFTRSITGKRKVAINFANLVAAFDATRYTVGGVNLPGSAKDAMTTEQIEQQMIVELQKCTPEDILTLINKACESDAERAKRMHITPAKLAKEQHKVEKTYQAHGAKGANLFQLRANRIRTNKYMMLPKAIEKLMQDREINLDSILLTALSQKIDQLIINDKASAEQYIMVLQQGLQPILINRIRKGDIDSASHALFEVKTLIKDHYADLLSLAKDREAFKALNESDKNLIKYYGKINYWLAAVNLYLLVKTLQEQHPEIALDQNYYEAVKGLVPSFSRERTVKEWVDNVIAVASDAYLGRNYRTNYIMYFLVSIGCKFANNAGIVPADVLLDKYGNALRAATEYLNSDVGKKDQDMFAGDEGLKQWIAEMQAAIDIKVQPAESADAADATQDTKAAPHVAAEPVVSTIETKPETLKAAPEEAPIEKTNPDTEESVVVSVSPHSEEIKHGEHWVNPLPTPKPVELSKASSIKRKSELRSWVKPDHATKETPLKAQPINAPVSAPVTYKKLEIKTDEPKVESDKAKPSALQARIAAYQKNAAAGAPKSSSSALVASTRTHEPVVPSYKSAQQAQQVKQAIGNANIAKPPAPKPVVAQPKPAPAPQPSKIKSTFDKPVDKLPLKDPKSWIKKPD